MFAELYVAASGMAVRQEKIDVLAHNLANVNTVGFKVGEVVLEERPLEAQGGSLDAPSHVRLVERRTDFSQGELQHTGEPLDVALGQAGFFVVESPDGVRLSRDGRFSLDPDGRLMLRSMPVLGEQGEIRSVDGGLVINQEGQVISASGPVGKLRVVNVADPQSLIPVGDGLYAVPEGVSLQEVSNAQVFPGHLEMSNANSIRCMVQMIEAVRAFEMNQRMVQTLDRLGERAVQELSRTA
jgi:flagellar basal-body rod protein FlgF